MGCCKSNRTGKSSNEGPNTLEDIDNFNSKYLEFKKAILEEYDSNHVRENHFFEYLEFALKEENFEVLKRLVTNNSLVEIDNSKLNKHDWVSDIETYGEYSLLKTLDLIKNKVEQEIISIPMETGSLNSKEEAELNYQDNYLNNIKKQQRDLCEKIEYSGFISFLISLLKDDSCAKRDISILIISYLSIYSITQGLLLKEEVVHEVIAHVDRFRLDRYKSFKEHIVTSFLILKNIYVKDINLRRYFIENGGLQLIYEFLVSGDVDIILEILSAIQDLIYKDTDGNDSYQYSSYSKILLPEMVELLISKNIQKRLYDLYNEFTKNRRKYSKIEEELKLLLTVFTEKDKHNISPFSGLIKI